RSSRADIACACLRWPLTPSRGSLSGKVTPMAGILLPGGFGVKGKPLQDIVVGLRCGKVARKMAGGKWAYTGCGLRSGGIYGKRGIQFWRRKAGNAEFGRVEIEILADCDRGGDFRVVDGVDDVGSDRSRGCADAVRKSDGRCAARGNSFDQSTEVRGKDD